MHSSLILPFLLSLLLLICCANAAAETHEHDRSEDLTEIHANCSSIIVHATIDANASHVAFTGVANNSNYDCFAPNVTKRDVSFFTVYSKRLISFRDVNDEIQRGKVCNVSIRGWAHAINATDKVDFNLPVVDNRTTIECFMSLETPSSSTTPTPTKTIEAHHHHTTTTTTTTSHHRATTTHHTTESTTTTTTTTTTHHRTTHKPTTTTTTTTKKAKPTHSSDDDDDDDDANWVTGEVTFFTPDNGACENDKETMIAALGYVIVYPSM